MTKKQSQRKKILHWLQAGHKLTPLGALKKFGCFRLGARVWELKRAGFVIGKTMVHRGQAVVAEYRLKGKR